MEHVRRKPAGNQCQYAMHEDVCAAGHGRTARSVRKTTEHLKFMFRKRSRSATRGMAYKVFCIYVELGDENRAMDEWCVAEQRG